MDSGFARGRAPRNDEGIMSEAHDGVVDFRPLSAGRKAIVLGQVDIGEIAPVHGLVRSDRLDRCFRIDLPGISSRAWRPARDTEDAKRQALQMIDAWLQAAGLQPVRAIGRDQ
jgi:hypothetical protein